MVLILTFDILWCLQTTFRSMSFIQTYIFAITLATIVSLPTAINSKRLWIQTVLLVILAGIFESNLLYFRTYFSAIPASSYLLVGNLTDFGASVLDSFRVGDIFILFPVILGPYLAKRVSKPIKIKYTYYIYLLIANICIAVISCLPVGGMISHINYLTNQCYYTNTPPVIYTPFGKIISDISDHQKPLSDEDKIQVKSLLGLYSNINGNKSRTHFLPPENVVIIFLESFESWTIGAKIEGKELTPTLNSLIADSTSLYFSKVATQVGAGRSIDAQLLILSGLYPMQNEVYSMKHYDNKYYSIPKALKQHDPDIKSYLLTGDKATVWNQIHVAKAFGIDTLLDADNWNITEKIGNPPKLSDNALFSQIVDKMRNKELWADGTNAYTQIIAYSTHNPFIIPEKYRKISYNHDYGKLGDYMTAINYTDHSLKQFIDYLKTRDDYNKTMIIIVGDHEGIEAYRKEWHENYPTLVSEGQFTPLIIIHSPIRGQIDFVIGQIDVYTTLLQLMGLDSYKWQGLGISAFNPLHPHAAINSKGQIITDKQISDSIANQLKEAQKASNTIIKYDLLK